MHVYYTICIHACLQVVLVTKKLDHVWDLGALCNGILSGLVSINAGCATVLPWHAMVIGVIGGFVYIVGSRLELKLKIDDPLDAFAVHGCCGFWGCIATAFFSVPTYARGAGGGLFYGESKQLALTVLVLLAEISWTSLIAGTMFLFLKKGKMLRITNAVEDVGMDLCKTGGSAYSFEGNGDPALGNGRPARSGQVGVSMPPHSVQPVDEHGSPSSLFSH